MLIFLVLYHQYQNLYENQVYLSEEDENELLDIIESFDLTDDEIEYFVENYEEFYQDEEVILLENPLKALKTLKTIRSAGKFGGGIKTGINLQKSAKRANIKNMLGRKPFDPVGKKFSGPVNLNKNFILVGVKGPDSTIFDAESKNRHMTIEGQTLDASKIIGITFRNGKSTEWPGGGSMHFSGTTRRELHRGVQEHSTFFV